MPHSYRIKSSPKAPPKKILRDTRLENKIPFLKEKMSSKDIHKITKDFSFWRYSSGDHLLTKAYVEDELKKDVTEIFGKRLLLGSLVPAHTKDTMDSWRVKNIISAHGSEKRVHQDINYRFCSLADGYQQSILSEMLGGFPLIERALSIEDGEDTWDRVDNYGAVFVHCTKGISRSTSVIIGYLVCRFGFKVEAALELIRSRRFVCYPNVSFNIQLRHLERLANKCADQIFMGTKGPKYTIEQAMKKAQPVYEQFVQCTKAKPGDKPRPWLIPSVEAIAHRRFLIEFEDFMEMVSTEIEVRGTVPLGLVMDDLISVVNTILDKCEYRCDKLVEHKVNSLHLSIKRKKFKEETSDDEGNGSKVQTSTDRWDWNDQLLYGIFGRHKDGDIDDWLKSGLYWHEFGTVIENMNVYKFAIIEQLSKDQREVFIKRLKKVSEDLRRLANIYKPDDLGIHRALCVGYQLHVMAEICQELLRKEGIAPSGASSDINSISSSSNSNSSNLSRQHKEHNQKRRTGTMGILTELGPSEISPAEVRRIENQGARGTRSHLSKPY